MSETGRSTDAGSALAAEAQELLRRLVAFDTVNPPGNERPAQEYLAALLRDAGFECELLGAEPGRPNLVARLRSERNGSAGEHDGGPTGDSPTGGGPTGGGPTGGGPTGGGPTGGGPTGGGPTGGGPTGGGPTGGGPTGGGPTGGGPTGGGPTGGGPTGGGPTGGGPTGGGPTGGGPTDGPTLCYLGHVDTVLAEPSEWSHDPWSGDLAEGCIWGRGALDMKSQVAAEIAAAISLARSGWRPAHGELLIVAVVDEETGGSLGAEWITKTHPEKVRCDLLINEGGGAVFEYRDRRRYGVCCAEKGVFRFTVATEGVAGHASMPKIGENALLKMGPLLARLAARQPSYELTAEPAAFLRGLGEDPADPARALANMLAIDPRLVTMFEPMFGVTFTPTRIKASEKINVIPSRAELKVDCRVPPGLGEDEVRRGIAEVLGDPGDAPGFQIEFTERVVGNRSPADSPLMDAIAGWVAEHDPGAEVVPVILPGFTDSRHFRAAFPECVAYGFFPQRHQSLFETSPLIHAPDERIDVRDLTFAAEFFRDLARSVLGEST